MVNYWVSPANIVSEWMGESENLIKGLFDLARRNKPADIFLDEIDNVMGDISDNEYVIKRIKTEFLIQKQGIVNDDEGILVLRSNNIPWGFVLPSEEDSKKKYIFLCQNLIQEQLCLI